jgi:uncharacterized protein (DUF697 family)
MQIRKKWLNQLKACLTNILKNIIWHLFAGESRQVVKITVTCCVSIINGKVVQGWAFSAGRLMRKKNHKKVHKEKKPRADEATRINFEKYSH